MNLKNVKKIAELVMLNVRVADVVEARQGGWLRWVKGAWVIKGDTLKTKTYDVQRRLCAGQERESNLRDGRMPARPTAVPQLSDRR